MNLKDFSLAQLQDMCKGSMVEFLEIEFTDLGENSISAKMPVNEKTKQPMGVLHGGASVVLAETLGSIASNMVLEEGQFAVGLDINANHIKSTRKGFVHGKATPLHLGKRTHVWNITITDELDQLICSSRLTVAVMDKK